MTTWLRDETTPYDIGRHQTARVTEDGAAWLTSATARPDAALALWERRPATPAVLPCGTVFDVVNVEPTFGRRMLDMLWAEGPGCGPVATHRGRMLLFAAPGTAQRLPSLLGWEEWGDTVPRPLCHGPGDAVTIPPLAPAAPRDTAAARWLVAPDTRRPWLPGPEVLLWACVRAARAVRAAASTARPASDVRGSISRPTDRGANVYDVSRRR